MTHPTAWAGAALGAAVAIGALLAVAGPFGPAADPFVFPSVAAVHALAVVPLVALIGSAVGGRLPVVGWVVLGIAAFGFTILYGAEVGDSLEVLGAGPAARGLVRVGWCVALALPWAAVGARLSGNSGFTPGRWAMLAGGLAAFCVPTAFVYSAAGPMADELADEMRRSRAAAALTHAEQLCRLGATEVPAVAGIASGETDIHRLRAKLRTQVAELDRSAATPLPPEATPAEARARATVLAKLDRFAEAEALLAPLADRYPDAELLLAAVLQAEAKYEESSNVYRRSLGRSLPFLRQELRSAPAGLAAIGGLPVGVTADFLVESLRRSAPETSRRAYDGLAFNARKSRDFDGAAAWYREAIERVPEHEAYFRFALGLTFEEADRPHDAVAEYRRAAALDPQAYAGPAGTRADRLRRELPGCLIRPSMSLAGR